MSAAPRYLWFLRVGAGLCERGSVIGGAVLSMSGRLVGNSEGGRRRKLLWSRLDAVDHERDGHLSR